MVGSLECRVLHRGVPAAFLPWMVGGNRGSAPLLQRREVVRGQRRGRDPSVLLAMVDVAADAAADRVLAEISRRKARSRRSGAAEIRCSGGARSPRSRSPPCARWSGRTRRARSSCSVTSDISRSGFRWAHAVSVSLHAVGLPGVPGAGGDRRGRVARRGRDVGVCRAAPDDTAGLHDGPGFLGGTVPGRRDSAVCDIPSRRRGGSGGLPGLEPARWAPRTVAVVFVAAAAILFVYYFPIWTGISIDRAGYYARMWLQGPGLRNWI